MCCTKMRGGRLSESEFGKTSVCKDQDVVYSPSLEGGKNCKMRVKIEKRTGYKMGQEQENRVTVYKGSERRSGWIVGQEARDAEE